MYIFRNGFSIIYKLKNNLGINSHYIPKYDNYGVRIINSINIDAFLYPSYLPSKYELILNKKNMSTDDDIICIRYILHNNVHRDYQKKNNKK